MPRLAKCYIARFPAATQLECKWVSAASPSQPRIAKRHSGSSPPMALPPAATARTLKHRRSIDIEVFARGDSLWEVDARLTDLRSRDALLATGARPAGQPIHDLWLRLVIDERFNIVDAGAETRGMPYPGQCDAYGDVYRRLVGLNLMQGFRAAVRQRLGGVLACTHITEMTQALPTAVVQAFAGTVIDTRGDADSAQRPFQIDRCHALRAGGEVVRIHYPRWYRQPAVSPGTDTESLLAAVSHPSTISQESAHEDS